MSLHNFTNTTNSHLVLGGERGRVVVPPGGTVSFDSDWLIAEDLTQVAAGDFTVSPALPSGISESVSGADKIGKIIEWIIANDTQIKYLLDPGPIVVPFAAPVTVELNVTDGDGTIDTFNDVATVDIVVVGNAVVAEPNPIQFVDGVAQITVVPTTPTPSTLQLANGPAGLNISSTLTIIGI